MTGDAKGRNVAPLIHSDQDNFVVGVTVVESDLNFAGVADQVIGSKQSPIPPHNQAGAGLGQTASTLTDQDEGQGRADAVDNFCFRLSFRIRHSRAKKGQAKHDYQA
jgi:hypothetical protein